MYKFKEFFPHSIHAFSDSKIQELFDEHGFEGLGVYWTLLELMAKNPNTILKTNELNFFINRYKIKPDIINYLTKKGGLFAKYNTYIVSRVLKNHFDGVRKKSLILSKNRTGKINEKTTKTKTSNEERSKCLKRGRVDDSESITRGNVSPLNNKDAKFNCLSIDNQLITYNNIRYDKIKNSNTRACARERETLTSFLDFSFFKKYFIKIVNNKLNDMNAGLGGYKLEWELERKHSYICEKINANAIENWQSYFDKIAEEIVSDILNFNMKQSIINLKGVKYE